MLDKDGMPQTEEVEVKIPAFRAVSVFDVAQTEGEPLPELEAKELLSTVEGYEDFIKAVTMLHLSQSVLRIFPVLQRAIST